MDKLIFLGTGDAMGVPRVYCDCEVCNEARVTGMNRRFRSSVVVEGGQGHFWIDCGPDFATMMERRGQRFVEHILVTHAHFDHIGGLPEWADACRWVGRKGQLYAPQEVLEIIMRQYPWIDRNLELHAVDQEIILGGWHIKGWKVFHGKNGYSYAYRLEKNGYAWVYCSDAIALPEEQKQPLQGLDLLVLGTSFYHEKAEFSTRSVYDVTEALELITEITPKRTIFTHMSHDIDLNRDYPLPKEIEFALTGLEVELGQPTRINIQAAEFEDLPSILELQKLCYQSEAALYPDSPIPPLSQTLQEIQGEYEKLLFLKVENSKGEIIASVRASDDTGSCLIHKLMVHPQYQGLGIGRRLMKEIENRFNHCNKFELFTGHKSERNINMYERFGYRQTAAKVINPYMTLIWFEKKV